MPIAAKRVSGPPGEPVTLSEVKNYLRIDGAQDDAMLTGFITAAREAVERYTGRKLMTQVWDLFMDAFPADFKIDALQDGFNEGALSEYLIPRKSLELPYFPLQSIEFLKTYNDAGTEFTMDPSGYIADTNSEPGRIGLTSVGSWPTTNLRPLGGIVIRHKVGYGDTAELVPFVFKQATMEWVGQFYSTRGCSDASVPSGVIALLAPYRVVRI
jgi:hypothetical protein